MNHVGYIDNSFAALETGGTDYDLGFGSRYTSNATVTASIAGAPSASMMILVGSTNYVATNAWVPFIATPTVNLGSGDGIKTVNFYFNSMSNVISSYSVRIWLVTSPPALTITSPGSNTLDEPLLQLIGTAPEELASVTYDVSNSVGWVSNQAAVVLTRYFDTNLWWFTTNGFQAFDIGLTVGTNQISLHTQDLAGNMTTSNYTFTLDYSSKTNPPVVSLYWPTNGSVICGTNFGWRGWVADPTVMLSAQIVDSSGDTNMVTGIVERNGNFWADNLPLASGTNSLTLTATDAAGNVGVTNISVIKSTVNMAFTTIPDVSNQVLVTIDGTQDTSGYTVWVNGVKAPTNGISGSNFTWEAVNVPVNGAGTTVFEALAITNTDSGGYGTGGGGGTNSSLMDPGNPRPADITSPRLSADPDKMSCIICQSYMMSNGFGWTDVSATNTNYTYVDSIDGSGGVSTNSHYQTYIGADYFTGFQAYTGAWDQYGYGTETVYTNWVDDDYSMVYGSWYDDIVDMSDPTFPVYDLDFGTGYPGYPLGDFPLDSTGRSEDYNVTSYEWYTTDFIEDYYDTPVIMTRFGATETVYSLVQGGKAAAQRMAVFALAVTAQNITDVATPEPGTADVPNKNITVFGRPLGSDGIYYVAELDGGTPVPIPVGVPGSQAFTYNIGQTKYPILITATTNGSTTNLDSAVASEFCVGQHIKFQLYSSGLAYLPNSYGDWTLPTKYVNDASQLQRMLQGLFPGYFDLELYGSTNYSIDKTLLLTTV